MHNIVRVIFCDLVRQENTGKYIFIGIYAGEMLVGGFPYSGGMSTVLMIDERLQNIRRVAVRIVSRGGAVFGQSTFDFASEQNDLEAPEISLIPLPPIAITLSGRDVLELWASINDGPEMLAGSLIVKKAETQIGLAREVVS